MNRIENLGENFVDDRGRTGPGLLAWTVLGMAVGAGIALLCAPCSGRETRNAIADKARRLGRKAKEIGDQAMERVQRGRQAFENARETLRSPSGSRTNTPQS